MKPATGTKVAVDQQPLVLTVLNAGTSGVRPLTYLFEVAADVSFANKVFTQDGIQPGATGQTSLRLPMPCPQAARISGTRERRTGPIRVRFRPQRRSTSSRPSSSVRRCRRRPSTTR
jgi:hypothetical protein